MSYSRLPIIRPSIVWLGLIGWLATMPLGAQNAGPVLMSRTGGGGGGWSTLAELTAAADKGNAKARAQLGEMLLRGEDVAQDGPRALKLLEQAARAGEASAAFRIGMLLGAGESVPQDQAQSVAYLRAAAVGGVGEAFRNVGVAYSTGRGVKRDYPEALAWFILDQKHGSDGAVANDLRTYLTKSRRPEYISAGERRAPELERELAKLTVVQALPPPGPLVYTAESGDPTSTAAVVKLIAPTGRLLKWPSLGALQADADKGTPDALTVLGQFLLDGKQLDADTTRAVSLLERAAKAGSADAAQILADLYTKGTKIPRDVTKAFNYTLQAAKGGVRTAVHNLGALYANGSGTKTNYPESLAWLIVAQHYNLDTGQADRIRDYLSKTQPAEVAVAERRAAERIREIDAERAKLAGL